MDHRPLHRTAAAGHPRSARPAALSVLAASVIVLATMSATAVRAEILVEARMRGEIEAGAVGFRTDTDPPGWLEVEIEGPDSDFFEESQDGTAIRFEVDESTPDGIYRFEATVTPSEYDLFESTDDDGEVGTVCVGRPPFEQRSGAFRVSDGKVESLEVESLAVEASSDDEGTDARSSSPV